MRTTLTLHDRSFDVVLEEQSDGTLQADVDGTIFTLRVRREGNLAIVELDGEPIPVSNLHRDSVRIAGRDVEFHIGALEGVAGAGDQAGGGAALIRPPMMGRVEAVHVRVGDTVEAGQVLFVLEAMKMHNEVKAPASGVVKQVNIAVGDTPDPATVVIEMESPQSS